MKRIYNWLKVASPIISIVSLAGCIALSVVCVKMNNKIKATNSAISNYASDPHFQSGEGGNTITLLDILNQYGQQINDLYSGQQRIRSNQSNLKREIDRSNSFLDDYNSSRFFDDDWPMKHSY